MLKSKPYYWVVCDDCGANATEDSDYTAWGDPSDAEVQAEDDSWTTVGTSHYCWECWSKRELAAEGEA